MEHPGQRGNFHFRMGAMIGNEPAVAPDLLPSERAARHKALLRGNADMARFLYIRRILECQRRRYNGYLIYRVQVCRLFYRTSRQNIYGICTSYILLELNNSSLSPLPLFGFKTFNL